MLSDRSYMRESDPPRELRPLAWLIGGLVAAFAVQYFVDRAIPSTPAHPSLSERWFALTPDYLVRGRVWSFLTYSVLHDTGNLLHLVFNALSILFIGRLLLPAVGAARFWITYWSGALAAGVLWLSINWNGHTPLIGASGAVFALFALFCCQFAQERMTMLFFYVIPVTVVPRYLLMVVASITALFFVFAEFFPIGEASGIAHSAHLAGMAAGVIAFRYFRASEEAGRASLPAVELPQWLAKKRKTAATAPRPAKTTIAPRPNLKAEVDRILDKINTSGFASLTADEKKTLDEARALMAKH